VRPNKEQIGLVEQSKQKLKVKPIEVCEIYRAGYHTRELIRQGDLENSLAVP
jgi:hypothetical protein